MESHSFRAPQEQTKTLLFGFSLNLGVVFKCDGPRKFFFFFFNLVLLWGSVFSAAVIGKSLLTVLGSVCRSAHLTEHHRMDFISVTSEPVRNTLAEAVPRVAAARAHTHSKAGLICGSARFHVNDRQDADAVHFIHHDKSLNHSKLSHRVLGVLKCLIVYALFI